MIGEDLLFVIAFGVVGIAVTMMMVFDLTDKKGKRK